MAKLIDVTPPSLGVPAARPTLPLEEYEARLCATAERVRANGLDVLLVYADREHCGHQAYLCGVEPRFEESLLILGADGRRVLLLGNECQGYAPDPALGIDVWLFPDFSPIGQPRSGSRPLADLLRRAGLDHGTRVGCAGWKYLTEGLIDAPATALDLPSFIADTVRDVVGERDLVTNENRLFLDPRDGLRIRSSAAEIAEFEFAACATSSGVRDAVLRIRPGIREYEIERSFVNYGLPLSCHNMVSFGEKARRGLSSPSDRTARLGDTFTMAFGLRGSLSCRAGAVAASEKDLPPEVAGFYPEFAANYFDTVATWYESVRIGATAGEVFDRVDQVRNDDLYRFMLNPGHYLHIEEWSQSPFAPGDATVLTSGTVMQLDIIPVSQGPFCYANVEDGVVLADTELRAELQKRFPGLWERVEIRRRFLAEEIGIDLHESLLPLSNIPGWHAPYALDPSRAFAR